MLKKWWHEKTAYQIYPKSFSDSNGDGVGDLRGIIDKLDYLEDLGVEIVWISPIYQSPLVDQGYDVSDYYAIDPVFGTMDDMDELIAKAKEHNISLVMDLVVNHCSDQHEWFKKACEDPDGHYGRFFYLKKGGENGERPNNWRSYFGGSVWDLLPGHEDENLYYLHMFAKEQPDLNWENPELREEVYKNIRWWLEKGISGFRLDAIINIKKDLTFQSFPADDNDGMVRGTMMLEHADGVHEFLMEMKEKAFSEHNAFTIGELFNFRPEELERYIGDNGCFESIFDFSTHLLGGKNIGGWYDREEITAEMYKQTVFASKKQCAGVGMMANLIENHDEPRGVSHYIPEADLNETSKKMLGGITMMTVGLPFLFQGQEIGMENKLFKSLEEIDDISTIDQYHMAVRHGLSNEEALKAVSAMSRDNARTPIQWDTSLNAGFSTGSPWLPVTDNYKKINVADQKSRKDSVFSFYKGLIAMRKDPAYKQTIVYGSFEPFMAETENLMAFKRVSDEKTLLVLANYQNKVLELEMAEQVKKVLVDNLQDYPENYDGISCSQVSCSGEGTKLSLQPYQFLILEL